MIMYPNMDFNVPPGNALNNQNANKRKFEFNSNINNTKKINTTNTIDNKRKCPFTDKDLDIVFKRQCTVAPSYINSPPHN